MNKPTCTFPDYKFVILSDSDEVQEGDFFNWKNPCRKSNDYWSPVISPNGWQDLPEKGREKWIIIRPIEE